MCEAPVVEWNGYLKGPGCFATLRFDFRLLCTGVSMRISLILALCITIACPLLWGAGYSDELSRLSDLARKGKSQEAIDGYLQLAKSQETPPWLRAPLYFEIANVHAAEGAKEEALAALDQAVKAGYDDCLELQQNENMAPLRSDPRFTATVGRIRESEADYEEAFWLKAEALIVDHEIRMMVNANINRLDHDITVVTQSQIPTRETVSPGVLYMRELVRMWQAMQKRVVLKADQMRMQHVATMAAISGPPDVSTVLRSSLAASAAAEERVRAVQQRALVAHVGKSQLRSCADFKK
jgi:tetratricopeptide (TPR) repeat protein